MKGIKAALCFHSALHSGPMLFFPWPLLPCARKEFDKVTPGPYYLFLFPSPVPVLDSNSVSGRSGAASHLISEVTPLGCLHSFSLSPSTCLVIYFATEKTSEPAGLIQSPTSLAWCAGQSYCTPRNGVGAGFHIRNIRPLCLAPSRSRFILCYYLTEPKPSGRAFLYHPFLKHTFVSQEIVLWQNTLSFNFPLCILMWLTPTIVDLYYFCLRAPFSLI